MNIRPLHDRVVIRRRDAETTSKGGIVIPGNAAEKPIQGTVLAVGEGAILEDGKRRLLTLAVGDQVLFGQYAGSEVKIEGEELVVMRESDIMAVIDKNSEEAEAA